MQDLDKYLNSLLSNELKSSMGCTEPSAIAFATSFSKGKLPDEDVKIINVGLSSNMLKNALCVTIPNTNLCGIDIIVLLGLIKGDYENRLKILSNLTDADIDYAKKIKDKISINIEMIENVDPLYIDITLITKNHSVRTVVEHQHDIIKECYVDNNLIYSSKSDDNSYEYDRIISFDEIYSFVLNKHYDQDLLKKAKKYNSEISEYGLHNGVGLEVGRKISMLKLFSDDYKNIIAKTSAGVDARMSGIPKKVIINSGSGNQGITATVPILEFAKHNSISEEDEMAALALSHLVTIYIRSKQNKLSSACGAIMASAGVSAGIAYMLGCNKQQIENAIISFLASNFGILCDGAKATCSLKVASAISSAINCALLSKNNMFINNSYGIVSPSIEETIEYISNIEKELTHNLDKTIMEIAINNSRRNKR